MEKLFLPLAAWGTTAVPARAASNLGKTLLAQKAETVLGKELGSEQIKAIEKAHKIGRGEAGKKKGTLAEIGNYTTTHLKTKLRVLTTAGFEKKDRKKLVTRGVVGISRGRTELHKAAYLNQKNRLHVLIQQKKIDIDVRDNLNNTPLLTALKARNTESAKILLQNGAAPNVSNKFNESPLGVAITIPDNSLVKTLIEHGADLNGSTKMNPALQVIMKNNPEALEILLTHGANPSIFIKQQGKNLFLAAIRSHSDVFDIFIKHGIKPNPKDFNHLIKEAVENNNPDAAEFFVKNGFDPGSHQYIDSILMRTTIKKSNDVLEVLLKHGADPNARSERYSYHAPIHIAARKNNIQVVDLLLKYGADPNILTQNGSTPLLKALKAKNPQLTKKLLDHGADPNISDKAHETPLHRASGRLDNGSLKLLLQYGANPNAKTKAGETPLMRATYADNHEAVDILISEGALVDSPNKHGITAIHNAINTKKTEVAIKMLQNSKHINAQDKYLNTYLHYAARKRNNELVKVLLEKGADPGIANTLGQTPVDLAKAQGDIDTAIQILIWAESKSPIDRITKAEELLGKELSPEQARTVENAHRVGFNKTGRDKTPARIGNYTTTQLKDKLTILKSGRI